MAQQRISRLPLYQLPLPSVAVIIVLISYFVLNVGVALFSGYSPFLGVIGALAINLVVFLLLQPRWALPLYILIAAPTIMIAPASGGILSRLYLGNLLLLLVIVIALGPTIRPQRKAGKSLFPKSLMIPLTALVLVGLVSIVYSRLYPDPGVVYSFPNADVPLILTNTMEIILLLGLPVIPIISTRLIRTVSDIKWIVRAYIGIGMLYALGTIFATPLGLHTDSAILGISRPVVFGIQSSGLGSILILFATIALGQAFYASTRRARFCWWAYTLFFSIAVILAFGRTAWIALFFSVLVMLGFRLKKKSFLLLVPLFLLPLLIPGASDFFNPDKTYGLDRLVALQDAIAIWQGHPYFGVGAGNYQFFDIAYGVDVVGVAHNQFVEVLAEMGVQGLLCLLWSMVAIGWLIVQRFKAAMTSQGKAIALAYIGIYTTIIVSGFFASSFLPSVAAAGGTAVLVLEPYQWFLLGAVLAIPQWEKSMQIAAESDQPVENPPQATELRGLL